jgi:hypothetical protein
MSRSRRALRISQRCTAGCVECRPLIGRLFWLRGAATPLGYRPIRARNRLGRAPRSTRSPGGLAHQSVGAWDATALLHPLEWRGLQGAVTVTPRLTPGRRPAILRATSRRTGDERDEYPSKRRQRDPVAGGNRGGGGGEWTREPPDRTEATSETVTRPSRLRRRAPAIQGSADRQGRPATGGRPGRRSRKSGIAE